MKVITILFNIEECEINKNIKLFTSNFLKKIKNSKIVFMNKIYDVRSQVIITD